MRKIFSSRIFRILVCLALICCFLVNSSPIKAEASISALISTAPVWVPVATAAASILIALGVMASADRTSFNTTVNDVVTYLETSTTYVVNGMVAVWGVFGADQVTRSFVLKDMIQDVWCWLFDSGTVCPKVGSLSAGSTYALYDYGTYTLTGPGYVFKFNYKDADNYNYHRYFHVIVCDGNMKNSSGNYVSSTVSVNGVTYSYVSVDAHTDNMFNKYAGIKSGSYYFGTLSQGSSTANIKYAISVVINGYLSGGYDGLYSPDGLVLGQIQAPPESKQLQDTEVYTDYITKIEFCPDGRPDYGEDKKEHLPIAFPSTDLDDLIIGQTQEDSQSGENDLDFDFETSTDPDSGGSGSGSDTGTDTDPDSGSSGSDSDSGSWEPPKTPMTVDLTEFFPFCIPFDLFEFFKLLNAEPVAPVLHWEMHDLAGETYSLTIDLSEWDSVALLFRRLQLFLFVTGLAAASRKFIKW